MNNMPDTSSMTLESIALQKKELRKKLHVQKEIMTDTYGKRIICSACTRR